MQSLKQRVEQLKIDVMEYVFNRVLTSTTLVALVGFIIHIFYPQYKTEFDAIAAAYLINHPKVK